MRNEASNPLSAAGDCASLRFLEFFAADISRRFGEMQRVPFDSARAAQNNSSVACCHENVTAWVAAHPGDAAVRGWVTLHDILGGVRLTAHSVVRGAARDLFDITPLENEYYRNGMEFISHSGDEATFFEMKEAVNGSFDCMGCGRT